MQSFRTIWINEYVDGRQDSQEMVNANDAMNEMAAEGWDVVSVVPGTNAQTWGGLFLTFRRD